ERLTLSNSIWPESVFSVNACSAMIARSLIVRLTILFRRLESRGYGRLGDVPHALADIAHFVAHAFGVDAFLLGLPGGSPGGVTGCICCRVDPLRRGGPGAPLDRLAAFAQQFILHIGSR